MGNDQCKFLAHIIFDECKTNLIEVDNKLEKSCNKKIALIRQNPLIGTKMKYMPPDLHGMIYKIKVGGRREYSLCYIYIQSLRIAIGVYITGEKRKDINYRNFPWDHFIKAKQDFDNENKSKFRLEV